MKPTAPPVNRGKPGTGTARYFFITRSTTASPSRIPSAGAELPVPAWGWMTKVSTTLPFSMTSTVGPTCRMIARGLQPTKE